MANENQPGQAPQHLSSQTVPAGNHTPGAGQPLEKQMLELARREKEVRKMQESLKGSVSLDSLKERAQKDRNGLLKELGLDDLIQEDTNDPVAALRKQIEDMQLAQQRKEQEAEYNREFESFKSQAKEKPDDFEIVSSLGYEKQLFDEMKAHFAQHGEMPDPSTYIKGLEDTIRNQLTSLKGSKKFSDIFGSPTPAPQARHPLDQGSTLSHSDRTSTQPPTDSAPTMSRQQMLQEASKLIKFND